MRPILKYDAVFWNGVILIILRILLAIILSYKYTITVQSDRNLPM